MTLRPTVIGFLLALSPLWARAATYTITDLGTLGGTSSEAFAINSSGLIVGRSAMIGDIAINPVLFAGWNRIDLGNLGGSPGVARAINQSGAIVGSGMILGGLAEHAFAAFGGALIDLGTLGGSNSYAYAINDVGQIAGSAQTLANLSTRAFRYQNGRMQDLGTLGGTDSWAYGINLSGQVVGQAASGGGDRAFLHNGTTMVSLGILASGNASVAYAINNHGQIVGASNLTTDGPDHPFLYENGQMKDLGTLGGTSGRAYAINLSSSIVGESKTTNDAETRAFLYQGGQMQDLNHLVTENSGWVLTSARGINDKGQIVGSGLIGGQVHAYLLTPISPAGSNSSSSAERPRVYINGAFRSHTTKPRGRVEGSVGGPVVGVKYRIGKGPYRKASGGTNGWHFRPALKMGANRIQVISIAADGQVSKPAKVVIIRDRA